MIAVAETPTVGAPVAARTGQAGDARDLALAYLRYASACWRGEKIAAAFAAALDRFWRDDMPPAPPAAPVVISPHGAGGRGICWYQRGEEILGYVPGVRGGYRVPAAAVPRLLRCIPAAPRAVERHQPETVWRSPVLQRG